MEGNITYQNAEFYTSEYRNQFEIVDKVQVNQLHTLEN